VGYVVRMGLRTMGFGKDVWPLSGSVKGSTLG
jgi:hypothetical protein